MVYKPGPFNIKLKVKSCLKLGLNVFDLIDHQSGGDLLDGKRLDPILNSFSP